LGASEPTETENDKARYQNQRGINDTYPGAVYGLYYGLFHVVMITGQFLFVVYKKPYGNVDGNAEGYTKNQNGRRFYSDAQPAHDSRRNDEWNDIGNQRT
jgi:hypothetical protein